MAVHEMKQTKNLVRQSKSKLFSLSFQMQKKPHSYCSVKRVDQQPAAQFKHQKATKHIFKMKKQTNKNTALNKLSIFQS